MSCKCSNQLSYAPNLPEPAFYTPIPLGTTRINLWWTLKPDQRIDSIREIEKKVLYHTFECKYQRRLSLYDVKNYVSSVAWREKSSILDTNICISAWLRHRNLFDILVIRETGNQEIRILIFIDILSKSSSMMTISWVQFVILKSVSPLKNRPLL